MAGFVPAPFTVQGQHLTCTWRTACWFTKNCPRKETKEIDPMSLYFQANAEGDHLKNQIKWSKHPPLPHPQNSRGTRAQHSSFPENRPISCSQYTQEETICQATQISGWKPEDSSEKSSLCHQAPTSKSLPHIIQYLYKAQHKKRGNENLIRDPAVPC